MLGVEMLEINPCKPQKPQVCSRGFTSLTVGRHLDLLMLSAAVEIAQVFSSFNAAITVFGGLESSPYGQGINEGWARFQWVIQTG